MGMCYRNNPVLKINIGLKSTIDKARPHHNIMPISLLIGSIEKRRYRLYLRLFDYLDKPVFHFYPVQPGVLADLPVVCQLEFANQGIHNIRIQFDQGG